jgi:hypothetical protein
LLKHRRFDFVAPTPGCIACLIRILTYIRIVLYRSSASIGMDWPVKLSHWFACLTEFPGSLEATEFTGFHGVL